MKEMGDSWPTREQCYKTFLSVRPEAYPELEQVLYSGRLIALPSNIRLGLKIMPRSDILVYYEHS
jgi:hypothetical protein